MFGNEEPKGQFKNPCTGTVAEREGEDSCKAKSDEEPMNNNNTAAVALQ